MQRNIIASLLLGYAFFAHAEQTEQVPTAQDATQKTPPSTVAPAESEKQAQNAASKKRRVDQDDRQSTEVVNTDLFQGDHN
jgi:hypothetical protein